MTSEADKLIQKYNVPVPRYTSYPTVPHWQSQKPAPDQWLKSLNASLQQACEISIYVHLPFCEKLCTYCGCNKRITKNHGVEYPYLQSVLQEWRWYQQRLKIKPILTELHFGGGTPTFFSAANLVKLTRGILAGVENKKDASLSLEIHPSTARSEHLQELRTLGFNRISMGVQDISPRILKAINRDQTCEQIEQLTTQARSLGYLSVNFDLIYGLPFQEASDVENTMNFVRQLKPDRLAFYSYAHVPWKSHGQRAFSDADIPTGPAKRHLKEVGENALAEMGYHKIGMDHYALESDSLYQANQNGQLHRNFMGYTDQKSSTLVGLGCSAISESHDMYVQNEKSVEAYQNQIESGELAIFKGHHLSKFDVVLKRHIQELFCTKNTSWSNEGIEGEIFKTLPSDWLEMEELGLLEIRDNEIKILAKGTDYIRNICAAIDPYYTKPTGVFSTSV